MSRLSASLVVDLVDKTGAKTRAVIGNMDRLKRAERDYMMADKGLRLTNRERAMERLLIEKEADLERRRQRAAQMGGLIATGAVAAGTVAVKALLSYAELERQMTRIGITADASTEQMKAAFAELQTMTKGLAMPLQNGIEALDTLVASGMNLREAMAFLPAVLATAQASGATTVDVANTAMKVSSALQISAGRMQAAFDIMVVGGKAGQFELRDMAQYIPGLANSFATLGYKGEDGLKKLIAVLQTLREDTGDAATAATQAQNIFGKMYSEETANKFKNFGINLRKEMDAARRSGEDALSAFVRLSKQALDGDLSKLPLLFTDQEFRLGMQSLITSPESLQRLIDILNSSSVEGTVFKDVNRVLSDTQSKIDKLKGSFEGLMNSLGASVSDPASAMMDSLSNGLDFNSAAQRGMEKEGWSWLRRQLGFTTEAQSMELAYKGGYRDEAFLKDYWLQHYGSGAAKSSIGRQNQPIVRKEFPGGGHDYTTKSLPESGAPLPSARPGPGNPRPKISDIQRQYMAYGEGRAAAEAQTAPIANMNVFDAYETKLTAALAQGGDKIAEGGDKAAQTMKASADQIGRAIGAAAAEAFATRAQGRLASMLNGAGTERSTGQVAKEQMNGQFVDP